MRTSNTSDQYLAKKKNWFTDYHSRLSNNSILSHCCALQQIKMNEKLTKNSCSRAGIQPESL